VRDVSRVPGCEDCLRVTIGTEKENHAFLAAMDELMTQRRESDMFGTTSSDERDPATSTLGPLD
jgi:hypothetical protein